MQKLRHTIQRKLKPAEEEENGHSLHNHSVTHSVWGGGGQPSQWGGYLLHVCTEGVLLSHNLPMAAVAERFPTVVESLKLLIWHLLQ